LPRIGPIKALQRKPSTRRAITKTAKKLETEPSPESEEKGDISELSKLRAQIKQREGKDIEDRVREIQRQ
jgi:hypothetical protein